MRAARGCAEELPDDTAGEITQVFAPRVLPDLVGQVDPGIVGDALVDRLDHGDRLLVSSEANHEREDLIASDHRLASPDQPLRFVLVTDHEADPELLRNAAAVGRCREPLCEFPDRHADDEHDRGYEQETENRTNIHCEPSSVTRP